jgi:hypothetical protein
MTSRDRLLFSQEIAIAKRAMLSGQS